MVIRKIASGAVSALVLVASLLAFGHDATNGTTGQWSGRTWSNVRSWTHDTLPDGRATFTGSTLLTDPPTFSVDVNPMDIPLGLVINFGNGSLPRRGLKRVILKGSDDV